MKFKGQKCVITGGTKGIGRAIVDLFASKKAKVFTCSRTEDDLNALTEEYEEEHRFVKGHPCDVSSPDSVAEFMEKVSESFDGELDILVCCAGLILAKPFCDHTTEDYDKVMDTNVRSVVELCKVAYPLLKANGGGSVVIVGSVAGGGRAAYYECLYNATKAAVDMITKSLACEWADDGIRVNCVAPGVISTPQASQLEENPEFVKIIENETPLHRLGKPEEVAKVVAFLSSEKASYITGHILNVDGGMSIRGFNLFPKPE